MTQSWRISVQVARAHCLQLANDHKRVSAELAGQHELELKQEQDARARVAHDLKVRVGLVQACTCSYTHPATGTVTGTRPCVMQALVGFEKTARQRVQSDLEQEKQEGHAQRVALREQMRKLQKEMEQAREEELPHDWPTVKRVWLEVAFFKQEHHRSSRALRAAQTHVEVLQVGAI